MYQGCILLMLHDLVEATVVELALGVDRSLGGRRSSELFFKGSDAKLNTAQLPCSHADATGKAYRRTEVLDRSEPI
jgi:hypothetical protein